MGEKNSGASGLQFYSNNAGGVRNCRFIAPAGSGVVGLDLGHRDMNGPLFVSHCEVVGFRRGIACAHAVNGQVFEKIRLHGQGEAGMTNEGQHVSVRGLTSENAVPAVMSYGALCLIDAELRGTGEAANSPAVINFNGGRLFVRDVETRGYKRAVADVFHTPDSAAAWRVEGAEHAATEGPDLREYISHTMERAFPVPEGSLRLEVKETPVVPHDPLDQWANVDDFGADPEGVKDSSAAIQKAVDSGATTLFLPGSYRLETAVVLRGKVRRMVGVGGMINYGKGLKPDFRLADGESPVVSVEHFANIHGGMEVDTRRTLVVRSVMDCDFKMTARAEGAEWFFEDVVTHHLHLRKVKLWARQLNIENEGLHMSNDGGDVWILGYKTERGGTLLETRGGGRSEVLGGFSYTTTAGKLAPMFVVDESRFFGFFGEFCYNGDPFAVRIVEKQGGKELEIPGRK